MGKEWLALPYGFSTGQPGNRLWRRGRRQRIFLGSANFGGGGAGFGGPDDTYGGVLGCLGLSASTDRALFPDRRRFLRPLPKAKGLHRPIL